MTAAPPVDASRADDRVRTFAGRALGSPLRLTLTNVDEATASAAWAAVIGEFDAVDAAMSGYRADSAISRLNAALGDARPVVVEDRLYRALALSCRAWRRTDGRFDPRVLAALERLGHRGPLAMATAAEPVRPDDPAAPWLTRDPRSRTVRATQPLDLHGIGKGLALRWAWRHVRRLLPGRGSGALLDAGGDLVGHGPGAAEDAWLIAIEDPHRAPDPIAVVELASGAIATSSVRLAAWTDPRGNAAHHLIDPRSGAPGGDGLLAVTVAGPDPAWAEVRTKELFLAGARDIADLARRRDQAAWWVTTDGDLRMTPAARQRTRWP